MTYKLIALDMDGTLLNSQKHISDRTFQAIAQAKAKGIKVVLASGRPVEGMRPYLKQLSLNSNADYVAHYNGSIVENAATGEVLYQHIMDGKSAKQIAQLATNLGVYTHAFSQQLGLITPKHNPYTELEAKINGLDLTEMDFSILSDDHPIIKTMMVADAELLTQAITQLPAHLHQTYTVVQSAPYFLEFLNPKSNKGAAIQAIATYFNIAPQEVIAMGDAENDHHMLEYAGLGIAMGNAMPQTKAIADHITLSNDEDGVAAAIEHFVL